MEVNTGFKMEEVRTATTIDEMRAEIFRLSRKDALTHNAMNSASYRGLSGEDRYVLLAYHALKERAVLMDSLLRMDALTPRMYTAPLGGDVVEKKNPR